MKDTVTNITADHTRGYPFGGTTGQSRAALAQMTANEECSFPYQGKRIRKTLLTNPQKDEIKRNIKTLKTKYSYLKRLLEEISQETFMIENNIRVLYKSGCGYAKMNIKLVKKMEDMAEGTHHELMWENERVLDILNYQKEPDA